MKRCAFVFLSCLLALTAARVSAAATPAHSVPIASPRMATPLDSGWLFLRKDAKGAETVDYDDSSWQRVTLPHTYDAADADAGDTFYRGPAWYRRTLSISKLAPDTRTFIEFDGAALATEVWLNGHLVGKHNGGFARFRFDLSPLLLPGSNLLAARVDNSKSNSIAPMAGDFSVFGGLYRRVRLVKTHDVHFDMLDYGSSGAQLHITTLNADRAVVSAVLRLANDSTLDANTHLIGTIFDADNHVVANDKLAVNLPPGVVTPVNLQIEVPHPHLWNGVRDPYLYRVVFSLDGVAKQPFDNISVPLGIRTIQITAESGLLLNGKPYPVHGVAVHQVMRPGHGSAVVDADVREDFLMLRQMGTTGLRFAHYQHGPFEYDLADRMGFLVWTEVPFVNSADAGDAFRDNIKQQMRELIRQNVNHPSVVVWGIGNEVQDKPEVYQALDVAQNTAHEEDPSRPSTYAACCGPANHPRTNYSDVIAYNQYLGWYRGEIGDWSAWLDDFHKMNNHKPMAISEYGAGASVLQQEDPPHRPEPRGRWHPEQWQALVHEGAWSQIAAKPYLWASFVWVGFDFPSAGRDEGDHKARNDKGLITFDRKVKKDAYFWYQANWTESPMVYITSRRYTVRANQDVDVKIYTNQPAASLSLNGHILGTRNAVNHIATWHVRLREGNNQIAVTAGKARDSVGWTYRQGSQPPSSTPATLAPHE